MAEMTHIYYAGSGSNHVSQAGTVEVAEAPPVEQIPFMERLTEINNTWQPIEDEETGLEFEVACVNEDRLDDDAILFPSTSFSSLTHNAGNAIELAASGAATPDVARIYVAHPGSGASSNLDFSDWLHASRTGRLSYGHDADTYQAMPYFEAMARALENHFGKVPSKISADVEGGRIALGLMAALEEDAVEEVYLNGLSGISKKGSYSQAMLQEDFAGRRTQAKHKEYAYGEVTAESKKDAKVRMPRVYTGNRHARLFAWTYARALPNIPYMLALGGRANLDNLAHHAAFQDMSAALLRHEATITLQFNAESGIHDVDDCRRFGKLVMDHIPDQLQSEARGVELLVGAGSLDEHTTHPAGRMAAERFALQLDEV